MTMSKHELLKITAAKFAVAGGESVEDALAIGEIVADDLCGIRYEVQHYTLCDGWVNTWSQDDQPMTFASRAEAQEELDDFLAERPDYSADEFRITEVKP